MLTTAQRARLFGDWWPQICKRRGIDHQDREARLDFFAEAGIGRKSVTEMDYKTDFDKLKARCMAILHDSSIGRQIRQMRQPRLRIEDRIEEHFRCLALYMGDVETYVATICLERFHTPDWHDLSELQVPHRNNPKVKSSPLEQFLWTINGRLNGKRGFRARAGDSVHDMRTKAGLECGCSECAPRRRFKVQGPRSGPVMAGGEEEEGNEPF
jgi:hypothetical protein